MHEAPSRRRTRVAVLALAVTVSLVGATAVFAAPASRSGPAGRSGAPSANRAYRAPAVSSSEIAVFFEPGTRLSPARMRGVARALDASASVALGSNGAVMYVRVPYGRAAGDLAESATSVKRAPVVREVSPIFYGGGGKPLPLNRMALTGEVIVRFADGTPLATVDSAARGQGLTREASIDFLSDTYLLRAHDALASLAAANALGRSVGVAWATPNWLKNKARRSVYIPDDPLFASQWHLSNTGQGGGLVGADANLRPAWNLGYVGSTSTPIVIADDGLEIAHEDLAANTVLGGHHNYDPLAPDPSNPSPDPNLDGTPFEEDHGTACGGVAAARGKNATGVVGAAPEARLIGYKFLNADSDAVEADAATRNMNVFYVESNSWGPLDDRHLEAPGPLEQAALRTGATSGRSGKGVVYVWAGGNGNQADDDSNFDGYANSRYTMAVGASTNNGVQSFYSEPGANLRVNAPSNGGSLAITTVDRTGSPGYTTTNYTSNFGGTSSASPLVAGIVADVLQANSSLSYRDVQEILMTTAAQNDPGDGDWTFNDAGYHVNHKYGFGRVDAGAAVNAALGWTLAAAETSFTTSPPSPGLAIPDNNATGVSSSVDATQNVRIEYVDVTFESNHPTWNDLRVTLTAPSGTVSVLAPESSNGSLGSGYNSDGQTYFGGWRFGTARDLGESSSGTWTVNVKDLFAGGTGTFQNWSMRIYGTPRGPVQAFHAVPTKHQVALSWVNPSGPGTFTATRILRSTSGFATTSTAAANADPQTQLDETTAASFVDSGLPNGQTFYYTAFWKDTDGTFSSRAAARARVPQTPTALTALAAPTLVRYGGAATISGVLTGESSPLTTATVTLAKSTNGGASWVTDGAAPFDIGSSTYRASRTLGRNTLFTLVYAGDTEFAPTTSTSALVQAQAYLTTPNTPSIARRNVTFTTWGYLKPRHTGITKIHFWRKVGKGWVKYRIAHATNRNFSSYTKFVLSYRLGVSGHFFARAFCGDAENASTWSPPRYFTVR